MKLVILDRDGVINQDSDQFIKTPDEWKPIPGSLEAIAKLNHAGYRVVVASNQSGIGRGLFDMATLNAINEKMYKALGPARRAHRRAVLLSASGGSELRVPQAQAGHVSRHRPPLQHRACSKSSSVGDSLRDMQAAAAAGAQPMLVLTGKGTQDAGRRRTARRTPRYTRIWPRRCGRSLHEPDRSRSRARWFSSSLQAALTVIWSILSLLTFPVSGHSHATASSPPGRASSSGSPQRCAAYAIEVRGLENLPQQPSIVLAKHQSAWETLAFEVFLPPQVWVLRRSLLRVPFFGWGLAMMNPIAIDRGVRDRRAQADARAGTRAAAPRLLDRHLSRRARASHRASAAGIMSAARGWRFKTGAPVVPIAHNAGYLWGKNAFVKYPGRITVSIGEPIDPDGMKAEELSRRVEDWIENEVARLPDPRSS